MRCDIEKILAIVCATTDIVAFTAAVVTDVETGNSCGGGQECWSVDKVGVFLEAVFGLECAGAARANSVDGLTLMVLFGDEDGVALAQLPVDQASSSDHSKFILFIAEL